MNNIPIILGAAETECIVQIGDPVLVLRIAGVQQTFTVLVDDDDAYPVQALA